MLHGVESKVTSRNCWLRVFMFEAVVVVKSGLMVQDKSLKFGVWGLVLGAWGIVYRRV